MEFVDRFDAAGEPEDTHEVYSELARGVARDRDVPLIDMDERSQSLLRELGPEEPKSLYLHLSPGEHPNYPEGMTDDTHCSERGAQRMPPRDVDRRSEIVSRSRSRRRVFRSRRRSG